MGEDKIAILLSTFNGELFLGKQIDSILEQDFKNWELFVRDDGSKDSTINIIKKYSKENENVHFIEDSKRLGAAQSFLHLLQIVDATYYMFCDQDDIWYKNKISTVFKIIKNAEIEGEFPTLVFSDATVVDQDLKIIDSSFWHYNKIPPNLLLSNPDYINVYNAAPGCTMIFNNKLRRLVNFQSKTILMHDWYLMILALQYGKVHFSEEPLLMYRQHINNVVGAKKISILNRFLKVLALGKLIKEQLYVFQFVNKHTKIRILRFYRLKALFNIYRYNKH